MMDMDMPGIQMGAGTSPSQAEAATPAVATPSQATLPVTKAAAVGHDEESPTTAEISGMDSMGGMRTSFHIGTGDALWIPSLAPSTGAGYAGAIILLMLLTVSLRFVITLEHMINKRRKGKRALDEAEEAGSYFKQSGSDGEDSGSTPPKFKLSVLLPRASFLVLTMALGYLLMLAVMTFNVGYLLAILGGGFLGEIAFSWVKD
ncbi:Ctr copper transporter family-domain-containing protein [Microdochium trichocladiopsis]|uniref:Copper transport protein n=1 Tax=Microdochium trichocladiopsis TaxID=1682393 RepID=A0A9P9BQ46_9PEZI|nr:Ctr copper transporter family-domain-containing protein [Microdochium trichocladiopsis]KAH7030557.1 Ctr copper transporter family-domain-containing protein [Microdochium trichocladiopsis]